MKKVIGLWSLMLALAAVPSLNAQTFSVDWFTIDGGGGTSTGGVHVISGTIGQPDATNSSGGIYSLRGGFWNVVAIDSPLLSLGRNPANGLITVSWPLSASGFFLDQAGALSGNPIPWTQVSPPYQTNATHIFITVPSPNGNRLYRLRKP